MLSKNPSFTLVAVLTLALGIGACTAIFSVADTSLLRSAFDSSTFVLGPGLLLAVALFEHTGRRGGRRRLIRWWRCAMSEEDW